MQRTILITGSTDGIGKLAAIQLAKDGHKVYLHGRNARKLSTVVEAVKNTSKNEHVKGFVADFSNLEAVKNMAKEVSRELPNLDVLINNAGVYKSAIHSTDDGFDL